MKIFSLFVMLLVSNFAGFSQGRSSFLYNAKGQLFLDTTLGISHAQYKTWAYAENNLVAAISTIEYPAVYMERGIKPQSVLIVSFICDTSDIKEIKVLNDSIWTPIMIKELQKRGKGIATQLKSASRSTSEGIYMGKYYVPINMMLIDFYEQLRIQKAVPVIKGSMPHTDSRSH